MRKALIVGIDHYDHIGGLSGCVNDAHAVRQVLERHADGTVNFATPLLLTGTGTDDVGRAALKEAVRELFADNAEIALFYLGAPQGLSYGQRQSEQMVNKGLSVAAKYIKFRGFVRLDELEVTGSPLVMFHPRSS